VTYVKVAGRWRYVYRAIDQIGQVVDVFVATRRDAKAAHRFFERAMGATKVTPIEVTTDKAPMSWPWRCDPGPRPAAQPAPGRRNATESRMSLR
jgi:transposase-like protein